jgi:hypothetical protein
VLPQEQLISELKELNEYLEKRHRMEGTTEERRQRAKQKGVFADLSKLSAEEIASFFQGMPLVGVDGSLVNYGASYPYVLTFFRALAHTTSSSGNCERIWEQEVFSPLLPRYQGKMDDYIGTGQDAEEALAHLRWGILATLEAKVAVQALKAEPRLLVLDGGFARLKNHAPEIWNSLKDEVLEREVLMVGAFSSCKQCRPFQGEIVFKGEQPTSESCISIGR